MLNDRDSSIRARAWHRWVLAATLIVSEGAFQSASADAIPAFARRYRTSCSTCHTAAPKLNVLGEAFRLNGYRFPINDRLIRRDDPVQLGAKPWKELWPRAIWPGELAESVPLAMRIQNDVTAVRTPDGDSDLDLRFPNEIYLLGGANFGGGIAAFLEMEWSRSGGVELLQAKVGFQDLLGFLPKRSLNLWLGQQNLYLFTFTDRQIDRAAMAKFSWQEFSYSDVVLRDPVSGENIRSLNEFRLGDTFTAIEVNGLGWGRLYYALGVSQESAQFTPESPESTGLHYRLRYKLGGLSLAGQYPGGGGPVTGAGGQLLDRSLTLEHFGFLGEAPVTGGGHDRHREFGVNARALWGRLDLGAGYVTGTAEDPWGFGAGEIRFKTVLAKAEYLFFPWLIGSLKFDALDVDVPAGGVPVGFVALAPEQTRFTPGVIALIRQNVRAAFEAEVFTRFTPTESSGDALPRRATFRLDIAF